MKKEKSIIILGMAELVSFETELFKIYGRSGDCMLRGCCSKSDLYRILLMKFDPASGFKFKPVSLCFDHYYAINEQLILNGSCVLPVYGFGFGKTIDDIGNCTKIFGFNDENETLIYQNM